MSQGPPQPPPGHGAPPPGYGPPPPGYGAPPQGGGHPPGGGYPRYPHWAPENAPPPPPSSGSIWRGILIAVVIFVGTLVAWVNAPTGVDFSWLPTAGFCLWLGLAIFFTARPVSRRTGAGMFIAGGAVPVLLAGACVVILAGISNTGG